MLISYSHRFLFFHVAKAAGISVRAALEPYAEEPEKFKIKRPAPTKDGEPNPFYEMWKASLLHAKARDAMKELPEDVFRGFLKFAFVRNPWDLQVSMYHFILRETTHIRHETVKAMAGFEHYLEWVVKTSNPFPKGAVKLQKEIVADTDGRLLVDFIGRFETLETDFEGVMRRIGLTPRLPKLNSTVHGDYRTYYNDRSIGIVAECFREDIDLFGYQFDGWKTDAKGVGWIHRDGG